MPKGPRGVKRPADVMGKTEPFDAARYLASPQAQEELLNDALASGDAGYIAQALGMIARKAGVARALGVKLTARIGA